MKSIVLIFALLTLPASFAKAEAIPGKPAPAFSVKDAAGKSRSLAEAKGKWLVLEWFNQDCPYVKKHYESGNMQKIQKTYTDKGVMWLTVISSAKGKQGYVTGSQALKMKTAKKMASNAILLDASGEMGRMYGAKTTPHMFVINPQGEIAYAGGIDDNDSADAKVIAKSKNYVISALDAGLAGKKIEIASARPYGCSVKYE